MEGLSTGRLRLPNGRAPGGLGLVQELVNTSVRPTDDHPPRVADLLATADSAAAWLAAALGQWAGATGQAAPAIGLGPADLAPLRRLRESVRALAGESPDGGFQPSGLGGLSVAVQFDASGRCRYGTTAAGWRGVAALVAAEILLAQHSGAWERFRTCPYPVCGIAFYDESKNNSRVWHDVRTCGNRTNLAASRGRRRGGGAEAAGVATVRSD
jgi:predicted RNA-binding Zn ribbon-like protein